MKVGITYDLREDYLAAGYGEEETAEFDRPDTIDAIENALQKLGFATDRIGHVKNLVVRLANGERWGLVFNIAEGLKGCGREAQVPALLDAYDIPYTFSEPLVLALTLHKGLTKRVIRDMGLPTPDFAVIESGTDCEAITLPFPLFAKPVAEGTSKGITAASRIQTRSELISVCKGLLTKFQQPVLIESFLPGREFTVGIVGTGTDAAVIGVMEVIFNPTAESGAYSYLNKKLYEDRVEYRLTDDPVAEKAGMLALSAWRGMGCRDGGRIDLRQDAEGTPQFIEVNPLPGLNPVHSDLPILCRLAGVGYDELIARIVHSALKRIEPSLSSFQLGAPLLLSGKKRHQSSPAPSDV